MSILDKAGQLMGSGVPGGNASLLQTVLSMVNNHPGGISGLAQSFESRASVGWFNPGLGAAKPAGQW